MLTRTDHPAVPRDLAFARSMVEDVQFGSEYRASADVATMRAATQRVLAMPFLRQVPEDIEPRADVIAGVPGEWLVPRAASQGAGTLLYFHGGGYVRGSLALGRSNAAELARLTGLRCFAVAYRQAPEHPFPAPIDDAVTVCRALGAMGGAELFLAGESAGGGIVVATAMRLRDEGGPRLAAVIAVSPFLDMTQSGASWDGNAGKDITTREMAARMVDLYIGDADPRDPLASPLFGSLAGLPRLLVQVGGHEVFLSEAVALSERAAEAGNEATLHVFEAMPHGFVKYRLDAATLALHEAATWLTTGRAARLMPMNEEGEGT